MKEKSQRNLKTIVKKKSSLAILARKAVEGQGKRRLAATLGNEQTFNIYKQLIAKTSKAVQESNLLATVFFDPVIGDEEVWPANHFTYALQPPFENLGDRIAWCVQQAFSTKQASSTAHAGGVIVLGTDCPYISGDLLQQADQLLDSHDAVIGPSTDGGYYLLGINAFDASIFNLKAWSTDTVAEETRQKIAALGWTLAELPALEDIDDQEAWFTYVKTSSSSR